MIAVEADGRILACLQISGEGSKRLFGPREAIMFTWMSRGQRPCMTSEVLIYYDRIGLSGWTRQTLLLIERVYLEEQTLRFISLRL